MTPAFNRARGLAAVAGAGVVVAATIDAYARTSSPTQSAKALAAAIVAVAAIGLAISLPGKTVRGTWVGIFFVVAGILTWTYTERPIVIWALLAVQGLVFAAWSWPWLTRAREVPRLGSAWLGLAYWLLGIVGAVLVGHLNVAAQRVAYAGVFALAVMAVLATVRGPGVRTGDPSVGIAAAMIVGIAVLLLAGSGNLFDSVHQVPAHNGAAQLMKDRFWGGLGLFFQPNSMAGLAIAAAIRIGPDRAFSAYQRFAATGLAAFVLFLTNSRIGFVFAAFAALLHAILLLLRRHQDLPAWRRPWLAMSAPFVMLVLVLALSGGKHFLVQSRFTPPPTTTTVVTKPPPADPTSGRLKTWKQVATDWRNAGWAEKIFGDAQTSRAVVIRTADKRPGVTPTKLNTDNAAVGAFRRGGVLGALAFVFGLLLVLWRVVRLRGGELPAAWFTILAIGAVPTIATEDWMLGGTNGGIWILLLAGEAAMFASTRASARAAAVAPSAADGDSPAVPDGPVPDGPVPDGPVARVLSRRGAQ